MKVTVIILSAFMFPSIAVAGQDDPLSNLINDWQAFATMHKHLGEDTDKLIEAYKALKIENEKLKASQPKVDPKPPPPPSP